MRRLISYIALALFVLLNNVEAQVPIPGAEQEQSILLLGGIAHLGDGTVIENSVIGFEKGKLTMVADARTVRFDKAQFNKVIEITGKHVYPGFIAPNTTLGITEIDAVRATRDFAEVGVFKPHVRSLTAYSTDSKVMTTVRTNGVLLAQITPRSGRISGSSSIVQLDAWNWEDAVVKEDDGIHLNWPKTYFAGGWWAEPGSMKKNDKLENQIIETARFFKEAKAYAGAEDHAEKNIRFEAMGGIFDGSKTLFINTDYVKDITRAVLFCKELKIKKVVIIGGYDAWMVTDMLKENRVSVMLVRTHSLPKRPEDDVDLPYKLPYLLQKAGVAYCLQNAGDMEAMNTRNLPFLAGTAAAYGLTKEEALMSITLNTAKILGIDDKLGSLEVNKDATLFISTGDALDMRTNNVEMAFINGRVLDLSNFQKDLYEKYKGKYSAGN